VQGFIEQAFDGLTASFNGLFKNITPDDEIRNNKRHLSN